MRFLAGILLGLAMTGMLAGQQTAAPGAASVLKDPASTSSAATPLGQQDTASPVNQPLSPANPPTASADGQSAINQPDAGRPAAPPVPDDPKDVAKAKREFKAGMKLKSSGA